MFLSRRRCSREERNGFVKEAYVVKYQGQVSNCLHVFAGFFSPQTLLRLQFMLGLHFTPACVLLSVCSLHCTLSLHFTPGLQSAVCSPQSAFYTDRFFLLVETWVSCTLINCFYCLSLALLKKIFFIVLLDERKIARTFSNDKGVSNFNFPRMENYIMVKQSGQWLNELNSWNTFCTTQSFSGC